jgi:hypothetical protein
MKWTRASYLAAQTGPSSAPESLGGGLGGGGMDGGGGLGGGGMDGGTRMGGSRGVDPMMQFQAQKVSRAAVCAPR